MISFPSFKYKYTFYFTSEHELWIVSNALPENMMYDFVEGIMFDVDHPTVKGKRYFIDLSKVYMIEIDDMEKLEK